MCGGGGGGEEKEKTRIDGGDGWTIEGQPNPASWRWQIRVTSFIARVFILNKRAVARQPISGSDSGFQRVGMDKRVLPWHPLTLKQSRSNQMCLTHRLSMTVPSCVCVDI